MARDKRGLHEPRPGGDRGQEGARRRRGLGPFRPHGSPLRLRLRRGRRGGRGLGPFVRGDARHRGTGVPDSRRRDPRGARFRVRSAASLGAGLARACPSSRRRRPDGRRGRRQQERHVGERREARGPDPADRRGRAGVRNVPGDLPPDLCRRLDPHGKAREAMNGRMVSHYRVFDPLGGGGMGVVYDAEDTRLGRRVALKFVPSDLARDAQALARLVREARAVSALNHPHICTLFDIGEDQVQPFLVLERLEGKTLKNSLAGKAMPVDRVLQLGAQMADALAAAHAKGIVHRDVKPANVFVTLRGDVKLLDFGLAKVGETAGDDSGGADPDEATRTGEPEPLTGSRAAVGTVAYMSPEQARGEKIDARTDLFSLGAVLYEMATGKPAFRGATPAVIYEAILARDPAPPSTMNPEIPHALAAILAKALEKDRELRYQTAADLKVDLERARRRIEAPAAQGTGPSGPGGASKPRPGGGPPAA